MRILLIALFLLPLGQVAAAQQAGNAQAGKALWEGVETQCRNCHGPEGQGAFGPDLAGRALTVAQFSRAIRQPWGIMPAFTDDQISDQNIANIAAYFATLPPVAEPGPWRFSVPEGAPRGQQLALAAAGCAQCHGATMNGPRADAGAIDADFAWFTGMVYQHTTNMPQHRELLGEDPFFVRMGNYARNRLPESLLQDIWGFMNDLGFRVNMAGRFGGGTSGRRGITYPVTVRNVGLPGKGRTAEDVTVLVALPRGAEVVGMSGAGYQGVRRDDNLKADAAVWRVRSLGPNDVLSYSITLSQAPTGRDNLRGVVRWARPANRRGAVGDQANIAAPVEASALGLSTQAQPLMQPNISAAQARQIVDAVIAKCGQPGDLLTVSVAVVDRAGQPVMQVRADTASPTTWELAYRKAYTARTRRTTSLEWRDATAGDSPTAGQRMLTDLIPLGGGAPIMMGDQTLGGVGVSGAGGQPADSACAETGVAAIADQLQ